MDLCLVTNKKFFKNAINLVNSYCINSYNEKIFFYYFDLEIEQIDFVNNKYNNVYLLKVPKLCNWAWNPTAFFYKTYALNDCINKSNAFIYSDAGNVFNRQIDYYKYLIDDSIFLPYKHEKLINKFWTTKKCFEKLNCNNSKDAPQYWAGFQVYVATEFNKSFVHEMHKSMFDPEICLPDTTIKYPDGFLSDCIEHRQDQSVFSLLIDKYNRHQKYNHERQLLFGDWMTFYNFDNSYKYEINDMALSSRESKNGKFRFL